jgi:hypothetical protein
MSPSHLFSAERFPSPCRLRRSLYGTSMPGAGAVHHLNLNVSDTHEFSLPAATLYNDRSN